MRERIYSKIWKLSPFVNERSNYDELTRATGDLLTIYHEQGRLDINPFDSARNRNIHLPLWEIGKTLENATCIVTGGLGCVGSVLVQELLAFNVRQIIILDRVPPDQVPYTSSRVSYSHCDIGNSRLVEEIFRVYQPEFVFHTAAQRDPGYAESHVCETVVTNILGTLNIVQACERSKSVKQCVFSSTGKASRYFTEEIYAATKKICEFIFDVYSRQSHVKYSLVRFTHIIDNSLMSRDLERSSRNNLYVTIHSPGKYVTAQNAKEAARLMLNALMYAHHGVCNFLIVKNLEWPVESLEMALYYIKNAEKSVPLTFSGNPIGYSEKFFRGQLNWECPDELNLLINVYECKNYYLVNEAQDIIISRLLSCDRNLLNQVLSTLKETEGEANTRTCLVKGLQKLVKDFLKNAPKKQTVDILNWGLEKSILESEKISISDYGPIVPLMVESLGNTVYYKMIEHLFCTDLPEPILFSE